MVDVANEARVSQTTVSLVLNHADGARLSHETRQRVMKAAARLGYQTVPRGGAPAAATTTIGFVCDEFSTDPWTAIGLDGVREKAWAHGLTVTVMATRGDADMEAAALAQLAALPIAGLVYATINTRLIEPPRWSSAPLVLLNCHAAGGALASVVPGEVAGGHAATDVLIRAGHRRIGYVNGEGSMEAARHRLRGYRQALATADLPFDPELAREGNWQPLSGYEAARALMALRSPPTAIFCANDLMAVACYEALRELGRRIPDDVAVMGYDDREIAQHLHPPLTTVLLPHFEMGAIAVEWLIDAVSGYPARPRQIKVECPIVMRDSVQARTPSLLLVMRTGVSSGRTSSAVAPERSRATRIKDSRMKVSAASTIPCNDCGLSRVERDALAAIGGARVRSEPKGAPGLEKSR